MICKLCQPRHVFNCVIILALLLIIYYVIIPKFYVIDVIEQTIEDSEHSTDVPIFKPRCDCGRQIVTAASSSEIEMKSSCSIEADQRGLHQKVVSYCFYGSKKSEYYMGLSRSAESVAELYPGWTVRLYFDIDPKDIEGTRDFCSLGCKYSNLDVCYIKDLESKFKHVSSRFGMLWRFLVMGDPTVDVFAVRDLDSPVLQREVDAVNDWLVTNKTFHIMRDNVQHNTEILGGMWGARNTDDNRKDMQNLLQKMLDKGTKWQKQVDQRLLSKFVWPVAKHSMVAHDSFLCQNYKETKPWPSQRINFTFVGQTRGNHIKQPCPKACRPKDHKDWIYC